MSNAEPTVRRRIIRDEGPDPIDVFVEERLRERRLELGLSQGTIARQLGITFQGVQKYETGFSRIAASTLYRLAQILDVPPGFFFEGYAGPGSETGKRRKRRRESEPIR